MSHPIMGIACCVLLVSTATSDQARACGVLGCAVKWVGARTGIKPIKKAGEELDNASSDIKKAVPVVGDVEEAVSRPVRETGKWIEKNPDKALIIAAVAVGGWAACVDGCTLIGSALLTGESAGLAGGATVAVPIITANEAPPKHVHDKPPPTKDTVSQTTVSSNTASTIDSDDSGAFVGGYSFGKEFPPAIDKNKPPLDRYKVTYKSNYDTYGKGLSNSFAPPVYPPHLRVPNSDDPAGGLFDSPRNEKVDPRAKATIGPSARRIHAGTDFLTHPNQPVFAPMSGKLIYGTFNGMDSALILSDDQTSSRVFYITKDPSVPHEARVEAGKTRIGFAADIHPAYPASVPNHIHVEYIDGAGRKFDPWTNSVAVPPVK